MKRKKKKNTKISFLQKTLSSKLHEVSPATTQKSIKKKIKIILFTLANLKFLKKNNGRERRRHFNLL